MAMQELSNEELVRLVTKLENRIAKLEKTVADLKATRPVPEEDLAIIAATAAAYMGYKGKVKAIRFAGRRGWAAVGRGQATDNRNRGRMPLASV